MQFSDQLEQRFATMVTHYPTKRSVLVPMLLYVQDELGAVTDEAITRSRSVSSLRNWKSAT